MEKKRKIIGILALLVLILAISNLAIHFTLLRESGETANPYIKYKSASKISIIVEISLLALLTATWSIMGKFQRRKATTIFIQKEKSTKSRTRTDLDILYDILKERKRVYISDVAKTFNVSEQTAMDWGKILEYGDLAEINYPRIGEPELVLMDKKK